MRSGGFVKVKLLVAHGFSHLSTSFKPLKLNYSSFREFHVYSRKYFGSRTRNVNFVSIIILMDNVGDTCDLHKFPTRGILSII
jgi:hypothetical protein